MIEKNEMSLDDFKELMAYQRKQENNFRMWGGRINTPFNHSGDPEFSERYYRNFLIPLVRRSTDLGSCYGTPFIKTHLGLLYSDYGAQNGGYSAYFTNRSESITIFESDYDFIKNLAKKIKDSNDMRCLDNRTIVSKMKELQSAGREGNCLFELNMDYSKDIYFGTKKWSVNINGKSIQGFRENEAEYKELAELIKPIRILPNLTYQ